MESSSIFDQFPVTQGDDQEVATFEGESQVSGDTDQTAAVDCQEEHCLGDEEGAAPGGAAAAEGRGEEAKPSVERHSALTNDDCERIFAKLQEMSELNKKTIATLDKACLP